MYDPRPVRCRARQSVYRHCQGPDLKVAAIAGEEANRLRRLLWAAIAALIAWTILATAMARADDGAVRVIAPSSAVKVKAGQTAAVSVQIQVPNGWHIFGTQPLVDGVKPSVLTVTDAGGVSVLPIALPPARKVHIDALQHDANVYVNSVAVQIKLKAAAGAAAGPRILHGQLSYQACSDARCLLPKRLSFQIPVQVVK